MIFSRSKGVVGLDIGSSAIKLVELKKQGDGYQLERVGFELLPPEAIVDGTIMDSGLVVDAARRLCDATGVKNSSFATSVSGHSVILKKIEVMAADDEELEASLSWEAEQYIPFELDDVRLDHVVLDRKGSANKVLLVAVKRDKVNDYVSVITQSGRTPEIVDIDTFAMQNAYEASNSGSAAGVEALLNIGASVTNVNVLDGGMTSLWRDLTVGGTQYTEALQRQFGFSHQDAEQAKRGNLDDGRDPEAIREALDRVSEQFAAEVGKTFAFFANNLGGRSIDRVVVTGGGSMTPGLVDSLQHQLNIPVTRFDPLDSIDSGGKGFDPTWLARIGPSLSVAVGLAMRSAGDKNS